MAKIAVLGTGGVGGTIGGLLADAGEDVTLIDPWQEHVTAMREQGLLLDGTAGEYRVKVNAIHTDDVGELKDKLDILVISLKSWDTQWGATLMLPHIHQDTMVVSAQNGLNEELIAPIVGAHRMLGCVVMLSTWLREAGHIRHYGFLRQDGITNFTVGELDGRLTPRVEELAKLMSKAGNAKATPQLWGERWTKMAMNCIGNALAGLTGPVQWGLRENPKSHDLRIKLAYETVLVGCVLGYRVPSPIQNLPALDDLEKAAQAGPPEDVPIRTTAQIQGEGEPSLVQDLIKGRRTEVEYLNGYIARRGEAIGVPTPYSAAITTVMTDITDGKVEMGLGAVDRVYEVAEANRKTSRWP